jgi:hypothetical protein
MPEFNNYLNKINISEQSFKEQINEFIQHGFVINLNTLNISPLFYGSADDFTLMSELKINEALLMTYPEICLFFQKVFTKVFIKSFCFNCEQLSTCQKQKIYLINLPNKTNCGIGFNNPNTNN